MMEWLVILVAALVASTVVAVSLSFARGRVASLMAAAAIPLTVIAAALPIYWFVYRDTPPYVHISIPPSQRYAASGLR